MAGSSIYYFAENHKEVRGSRLFLGGLEEWVGREGGNGGEKELSVFADISSKKTMKFLPTIKKLNIPKVFYL